LQHRFVGHGDVPLTAIGRAQALCTAEYLKDRKIDKIYSSDLIRAMQTAIPTAKLHGLPIHPMEELREIYAGKWEGLTLEEIADLYTDDLKTWREDFSNARCTGGESTQELYSRIVPEILSIAKEYEGKTVLAATHATPIRAVEAYANGYRADEIHKVTFVKNASLNIFEYDSETGKLSAIRTNIVDHLDDSLVTSVPKSLK
jgi:broad specificity phosphatase PhoE